MTYGTGPQAVSDYLLDNWQAARSGRNDIPDVIRDSGGNRSRDPDDGPGVLMYHDRQEVNYNAAVHDLIHCYHPEASGLDIEDRGYDEHNVRENIQIDIDITDRRDPSDGTRLNARDRMVGDRGAAGFPSDESPPYPGIAGEVVYLLEDTRRNFQEWDVARIQPLTVLLKNSDASVSLDVILEHVAKNTVQ